MAGGARDGSDRPAPNEYHSQIHPRSWRDCVEFSNGQTGDLCVHFYDLVRFFLGLGWPKRIEATGGVLDRAPESFVKVHDTQTALVDHGPVQVVWTQRNWGENPDPDHPWGAMLHGSKGTLLLSVAKWDFKPKDGGPPKHGEFLDEREDGLRNRTGAKRRFSGPGRARSATGRGADLLRQQPLHARRGEFRIVDGAVELDQRNPGAEPFADRRKQRIVGRCVVERLARDGYQADPAEG